MNKSFSFFVIAVVYASLFIVLTGCEDTADYKGVTFKPQIAAEDPLDTTVYVLAVKKNVDSEMVYEQSRQRNTSLIGSAWSSVNDLHFVLDTTRGFLAGGKGVYEMKAVQGGEHTLSLVSSFEPVREEKFTMPLTVPRKKMTLVLVDMTDSDKAAYRVCVEPFDHDFVLKGNFRSLERSFRQISTLLDDYVLLVNGGRKTPDWESIFTKDCRDEQGSIADRLMALRYVQNTGNSTQYQKTAWFCSIQDQKTGTVLLRGDGIDDSVVDYERFVVQRNPVNASQWLIASIGIDLAK